jgi:hypothetical protein
MSQRWFYARDGQQRGPLSVDQLKQMAFAGKLAPTDLVWQQGMASWVAAHSVRDLFPANRPVATPRPERQGRAGPATPPLVPVSIVPPVVPRTSDPSWYYMRHGQRGGPVSRGQLQQLIATGKLGPSAMVWQTGMANWVAAASVPNLVAASAAASAERASAEPLAVVSSDADEQLRHMLRSGETARAQIDGNSRFAKIIEYTPFVNKLAEFFRRRYVLVLTDQRLLALRVSRMLRSVKSVAAYPLADVAEVACVVHLLTSTVAVRLRDGTMYVLQRVSKQAGPDFQETYYALTGSGGMAAGVAAAIANGVEAAFNRHARR